MLSRANNLNLIAIIQRMKTLCFYICYYHHLKIAGKQYTYFLIIHIITNFKINCQIQININANKPFYFLVN